MSLEEVAVHADNRLLIEIDISILLIVGYLQGILDLQLRLHPAHL